MAAATNGDNPESALSPVTSTHVAPQWIEPSLFESLLKKQYVDFVKIKEFKVQPALAPGENYATIMLRVSIEMELTEGKSKSINYMMKIPHDNEFTRSMSEGHNIFHTELGMYKDIVPELEAMYRNVGLELKFGAEAYTFENVDKDYILLEDLRPRGFKNANRLECLDMDHSKAVLKKLAQWHAASAHRVATIGKYADGYAIGYFTENSRSIIQQMNENLGKYIIQCMETYQSNEVYIEDVKKFIPKQTDMTMKFGKIDPNEFNVLNHGDCWSNNIMFQYDAFGKIKETYLVDYQVPKYGTPAQDLLYFILSSTKIEIKLKEFDFFIKYYHDQLIEHLTLLNYPKQLPTLRDIHIMLYKYGFWGYCTATGVMGGVLLDPTENANIDNFIGDSDLGAQLKLQMFSNKRYRKHIEVILPWLHNRGALEI